MARKFTWDTWDYDLDGSAYIIAKDECTKREDVPEYICREDNISSKCKPEMVVEEGWCKYQVRSDWDGGDNNPMGGYVVEKQKEPPKDIYGRKKRGWFPVWIVRKDEWY